MARRRKRVRARRGLGLIAAVVLLLFGLVSFRKQDLNREYESRAEQLSGLEARKQQLLDEQQEIEEYKAYVQTKKYIEQVAREKLGLVYQDEILFQPDTKE